MDVLAARSRAEERRKVKVKSRPPPIYSIPSQDVTNVKMVLNRAIIATFMGKTRALNMECPR
jgi:hypothetical protein